jgi:hypothetical protein
VIRDRNIEWLRKPLYIDWKQFTGIDGVEGTGHKFATLATGTAVAQDINSLGIAGLLMDTANDLHFHETRVPWDMDPEDEVGFVVFWTSGSSTTADTIDFKVTFDIIATGAAYAAPSTALDTVVAQDTVTGAYHNQQTARGIKNAGFTTRAVIAAGAKMVIGVELDAFAAGLDEDKFFVGLEIDYKLRMTNS